MIIEESLFEEFRRRYGNVGANLVIFYTMVKSYGDMVVRMYFPVRSYYRYREALIRDGYLTWDDFRS